MKTIIEMAREVGLCMANDEWPLMQAFATLVKAARDAELLEGVEMPEPEFSSWHMDEYKTLLNPTGCVNAFNRPPDRSEWHKEYWGPKGCWHEPLFTAEQLRETVASAVAKKDAYAIACQTEADALRAENEKLRADAARYQWLTVNTYVGIAQHPKPHEVWCLRLPNPNNCNNLDAAIDAALKGQP